MALADVDFILIRATDNTKQPRETFTNYVRRGWGLFIDKKVIEGESILLMPYFDLSKNAIWSHS